MRKSEVTNSKKRLTRKNFVSFFSKERDIYVKNLSNNQISFCIYEEGNTSGRPKHHFCIPVSDEWLKIEINSDILKESIEFKNILFRIPAVLELWIKDKAPGKFLTYNVWKPLVKNVKPPFGEATVLPVQVEGAEDASEVEKGVDTPHLLYESIDMLLFKDVLKAFTIEKESLESSISGSVEKIKDLRKFIRESEDRLKEVSAVQATLVWLSENNFSEGAHRKAIHHSVSNNSIWTSGGLDPRTKDLFKVRAAVLEVLEQRERDAENADTQSVAEPEVP